MRIAGLSCVLPTRCIGNEEILDLIRFYSLNTYSGELQTALDAIREGFKRAGSVTRYWRTSGERPREMIVYAAEMAIRKSGLAPADLDLLIFVSVDRGFLEPSNASFIANDLGIPNIRCFDVVDACMAWCTAVNVVQSFQAAKEIRNALIVSAECMTEYGGPIVPDCFSLNSYEEIAWKFPAFTMGEAVSVTVLTPDGPNWSFVFDHDATGAELCSVPLELSHRFSDSLKVGLSGERKFTAFGEAMGKKGFRRSVEVLRRMMDMAGIPDLIVPHSVSGRGPAAAAARLGVGERVSTSFPQCGNVVTSSIPCSLVQATAAGRLAPGRRCLGWVASAGLKYSSFEIY